MRRTSDPTFLNSVINHPEVRPSVGFFGEGVLDISPLLADPANFALEFEGGGFVVTRHEIGTYECHTQFLPDFRGAYALESARKALAFMFLETDCMSLLTKVPSPNIAADQFARMAGFRQSFEQDEVWPTEFGPAPMKYYVMEYSGWWSKAHGLEAKGEWFHEQLVAKGLPPDHAEGSAHNRAVGAAVSSLMAGQVDKGVILYNRWARFAGFQEIRIVMRSPLVIHIGSALVGLTPRGFDLIEV